MNRRAFLTTAAMTQILASAFGRVRAQTAGGRLLYVGTYTNNAAGSKGIYGWRFDATDGKVTSLGLAGETDSPSWVVVHPNKRFLYAANELPPPEAGGPTSSKASVCFCVTMCSSPSSRSRPIALHSALGARCMYRSVMLRVE